MTRLEVLNEYMQSFAKEYEKHSIIPVAWDANFDKIRELRKDECYNEDFVELLDKYNDYLEECYREEWNNDQTAGA